MSNRKKRGSRGRGGKGEKPAPQPQPVPEAKPAGAPRRARPVLTEGAPGGACEASRRRQQFSVIVKAAGPAQGQAHAANSNAQDVAADSAQKGRNNSTQRVFPDTSQLPNLLAGLGDEDTPDSAGVEADHQASKATKEGQSYLASAKEQTSQLFGQTQVQKVVITVPACLNDNQRQATKGSGPIAGADVLRIVNEPTAASLADGFEKTSNETILDIDLGGGASDVSVLEVGDVVIKVLPTSGDTHLWGDDFDGCIEDFLANVFQHNKGMGLRMDGQALQRLTEGGGMAKRSLSTLSQVMGPGAIEFERLRENLACPLGRLLRGFYGFTQLHRLRPRQLPASKFHALWDVSGAYQVQMALTLVPVSAKTPLLASVSDSALALALAKVQGVYGGRTQVARATPDRKGRQHDPHIDAGDAIRRAGAFSQSQLLRAVVNVGPLAVSAIAWGPSGGGHPGAITHNADTGERTLETGAIVLAGCGISDLDEIGNMDRAATHEVTEQRTVALHTPLYGSCYDVNSLPPNTYQAESTLTQFTIQDKLSFQTDHKAVLMLDSPAMAADINHLDSPEHAGAEADSLPLDLGKIVDLKAAKFGSAVPVRTCSAADIELAPRQLSLVISTATFVLPVAGADAQSMAAAVQRIKAVLDMPLLHRAACSQSVPLMVQEWTSAAGINLLAGDPGPKGLTALHLAADMEDSATLAALLTGKEKLQVGALVLDAGGNASGCVADLQLAIPANKEIVLRDYASSGGMMIGADSHAPDAGDLGMCAVGVGGAGALDTCVRGLEDLLLPQITTRDNLSFQRDHKGEEKGLDNTALQLHIAPREAPAPPNSQSHAQLRDQSLCVDVTLQDSPAPIVQLSKNVPGFPTTFNLTADSMAGSGTQEVPTPVPAGPKVSLKRALKKALHCCSTKTIDSPAAGSVALSGGSAAPTQTAGSRRAPGRPRGSPFARLGRFFCMG